EAQAARELAEQCLRLAQSVHRPTPLVCAHYFVGATSFCLGEFALAQDHLEQGIALYDPQEDIPLVFVVTQDPGVSILILCGLCPMAPWLSRPGPQEESRSTHPGPRAGSPLRLGLYPKQYCHAPSVLPRGAGRTRTGRGSHSTLY